MSNAISTITTPFGYSSDIRVSFSCKGHKFNLALKNRGTKELFDLVCRALCGYDISDKIPSMFDIVSDGESCLKAPIRFSGVVYGKSANSVETEAGIMSLSAIVTYDDKQQHLTELSEPELQLKGKDGTILCVIGSDYQAEINDLWKLTTQDTNALIEWQLIFNNGGTQ